MMENVNFLSIGGLEENIQYLKDAILLPWKYSNVLKKFHVKPPRGVLFHGPPGTGKTLTAAALANECKRNKQKVSFFHQNAAECLTMWLGESERKLRELFKTAYLNRPAIIFFDELDALAPTRSMRMDHVHSSLVSTLLTLMDGLKSPTDVVVIGATNRLDEIDPALRRPGRFDKELFFPPPDLEARRTILQIHTRYWQTDISNEFTQYLAENTVGYCGADLEALCKEALMCAMKRNSLEQRTTAKSLTVHEEDFIEAKSKFVPACLRSSISPVCSLSEVISPLLRTRVDCLMQQLANSFSFRFLFPKQRLEIKDKILFCPRVLLTGSADQGLTSHLGPAILHRLEHLPVHLFDVTTLYTNNNLSDCSCIEALMSQRLATVRMQQPCIMYLPDITEWWDMAGDVVRSIFMRMMNYFDSNTKVMLLATAHVPYTELPDPLKKIFHEDVTLIVKMTNPTKQERLNFFEQLFERKKLSSSRSMQQISSGISTDDAESVLPNPKEAYQEPRIKTRYSRRCSSLGYIQDVSIEDNYKDTPEPQRPNKRCLHENENNKKRKRSATPEPSTSYGSINETSRRRDLSLPEKDMLFWANPAEGCESMKDEKIHQLLQRLVCATENNTVHHLEILYNRINMAIKKHKCSKNMPYLTKKLSSIHCCPSCPGRNDRPTKKFQNNTNSTGVHMIHVFMWQK